MPCESARGKVRCAGGSTRDFRPWRRTLAAPATRRRSCRSAWAPRPFAVDPVRRLPPQLGRRQRQCARSCAPAAAGVGHAGGIPDRPPARATAARCAALGRCGRSACPRRSITSQALRRAAHRRRGPDSAGRPHLRHAGGGWPRLARLPRAAGPAVASGFTAVTVHPGKRVRLLDQVSRRLHAGEAGMPCVEDSPAPSHAAGAQGSRRWQPRPVRAAALARHLGDAPFDRGDGTSRRSARRRARFPERADPGRRHRQRAASSVQLRACGSIESTAPCASTARLGRKAARARLSPSSWSGHGLLGGRRRHHRLRSDRALPASARSATARHLTMVCGGELGLHGRIPPELPCWRAPSNSARAAPVLAPIQAETTMEAGVPAAGGIRSRRGRHGIVCPSTTSVPSTRLERVSGDLEVFVQVAPPDPVEPERRVPGRRRAHAADAAAAESVADRADGRLHPVLLRAQVAHDRPLPALGGITCLGR